MIKPALLVSLLAICSIFVTAHEVYQTFIPNGGNIPNWPGVGHLARGGGGPRNPFGMAFANNGYVWDAELCEMDSDGDGKSNGDELGDPCCRWRFRGGQQLTSIDLSNPGIPTFTTSRPSCKFQAPLTPPAPVATVVDGGKVKVTWSIDAANSCVCGYRVYLANGSAPLAVAYSQTNTTVATVTLPAAPNQSYQVVVAAVNLQGESRSVATAISTPGDVTPPPVVGIPQNLTVGNSTATTLLVEWNAPDNANGTANVTGYVLQQVTVVSNTSVNATIVVGNTTSLNTSIIDLGNGQVITDFVTVYKGENTSFTVIALAPNTTYFYRVAAANENGEGNFTLPVNGTTNSTDIPIVLPTAPLDVAGLATDTSVSLNWLTPTNPGTPSVLSYDVEQRAASDPASAFVLVQTGLPPMLITGLSPATTYVFRVRANTLAGKGEYSVETTVQTAVSLDMTQSLDPSFYTSTISSPDNMYRLYWRILPDQSTIEIAMEAAVSGWVGFGISQDGNMVPADMYIATPVGQTLIVEDYFAGARTLDCPRGVCLDGPQGGVNSIIAYAGQQVNGNTTQAKFRRALVTGDALDVNIVNQNQYFLWAYGSTNALAYHGNSRGTFVINMFAGSGFASNFQYYLRLTHGILMTVAWAGLLTLGTFFARYLKRYPWWFPVHIALQTIGAAVAIAAFVIALVMTKVHYVDTEWPASIAHAWIGTLAVAAGVVIQPLLGYIIDRMYNPARTAIPVRDKMHWWLGRGSILLAYVNIFLGLNLIGAAFFFYIIFGVFVAGIFATILSLDLYTSWKQRQNATIKQGQGHTVPLEELQKDEATAKATDSAQNPAGSAPISDSTNSSGLTTAPVASGNMNAPWMTPVAQMSMVPTITFDLVEGLPRETDDAGPPRDREPRGSFPTLEGV